MKTVMILGGGFMGSGITQVCANGGLDTILWDITLELAEKGKARIASGLDARIAKGKETEERAAIYCGWQNQYDKETRLCTFSLSLFEEGDDGAYIRTDEEQTERCYTLEELTSALERAGFTEIAFFGDLDFGEPHEKTERWYITARCKKD